MKTMKALVKKHAKEGLWLEEVSLPEVANNDVLVKIQKTAICGTDVHIYNWDAWAQKTIPVPMTIGHEFAGEIVELGANVNELSIGDIVSGEGHIVCERCRNCLAGRRHLCPNTIGIGVNRAYVPVSMETRKLNEAEKLNELEMLFLQKDQATFQMIDLFCKPVV